MKLLALVKSHEQQISGLIKVYACKNCLTQFLYSSNVSFRNLQMKGRFLNQSCKRRAMTLLSREERISMQQPQKVRVVSNNQALIMRLNPHR
jgi:hypothetical protein